MERFPREKFWREVKEWTIYVAGVYYPYKITIEPEKKIEYQWAGKWIAD